ncbi:MAG: sucrase ferredoxin [Acidimicrobiia bacterium]|nr:sucrase ferredoxin [Acidimicrobiia bacterium]
MESRLDPTVAHGIRARARRAGARVVLIRQPKWSAGDGQRAYLVRTDQGVSWVREYHAPEPEALLGIDLGALSNDTPPTTGQPGPSSLHLICTNGRHDACCADLGRPVVRALHDEAVDQVWECSHVGGDRFAANLVCLPSGVYYGRVPPQDAVRLVRQHDEGIIDLDFYRGRSCYQPLTQAGEIFLRRELDERGVDALSLSTAGSEVPNETTARFTRGAETFEVRVSRSPGPLQHLTCSDAGSGRPWQYQLQSLRQVEEGQN